MNVNSLDTLCAGLCYAMDVTPPAYAAEPNRDLTNYIDHAFEGKKADRLFMYNPDAIGQWVFEKYPQLLDAAVSRTELQVPLCCVMPSVTPVCFGTMYTGAQPQVHGIQKYEKPVIKIDTIFDAFLRAGKKCAIIAYGSSSMGKIFLDRDMDYYIFKNIEQVNACAAHLICEDQYDFIVCYNGNYDAIMHKFGPESQEALAELRANAHSFGVIYELIKEKWCTHRTLIGFAMDHGCHEIDDNCGSHGLDMPEDLNIVHLYAAITGEEVK